jgi:hypothetical protein
MLYGAWLARICVLLNACRDLLGSQELSFFTCLYNKHSSFFATSSTLHLSHPAQDDNTQDGGRLPLRQTLAPNPTAATAPPRIRTSSQQCQQQCHAQQQLPSSPLSEDTMVETLYSCLYAGRLGGSSKVGCRAHSIMQRTARLWF